MQNDVYTPLYLTVHFQFPYFNTGSKGTIIVQFKLNVKFITHTFSEMFCKHKNFIWKVLIN